MHERTDDEVREAVRSRYGEVARSAAESACTPGCCGSAADASRAVGYSDAELAAVPDGANLGLGCGNPQAIAMLRAGETVLDLGSGAGFDCFLAARQVGPTGGVIGVDMTPEMVARARANARRAGATNVEFRLGEIEHLPVADGTIDVILSNCVINLSPDKAAVFREAFRALRPGGRLAISDVVMTAPLPAGVAEDPTALTCCIAGAASAATNRELLEAAGFVDIRIDVRTESREFIRDWQPGSGLEQCVAAAAIEATKPIARACCGPSS
ncbi:MAG: arsenite methyltransferase [Planctomycetes bacterium]|nr:arsenite methyltransferase [Planctomycetota bacterium]